MFEMHNVGTVPIFKMHNVGTVPAFKMHNVGTVPTYKMHNIGTKLSYATLEPLMEDELRWKTKEVLPLPHPNFFCKDRQGSFGSMPELP